MGNEHGRGLQRKRECLSFLKAVGPQGLLGGNAGTCRGLQKLFDQRSTGRVPRN